MDLIPKTRFKENLEIKIQKRQNKEKFKFVGSLYPKPNQKCFELDLKTMTVKESEYFYKTDTINWFDALNKKRTPNNRGVLIKDSHDYIIKLNKDNAVKYFRKIWNNENII